MVLDPALEIQAAEMIEAGELSGNEIARRTGINRTTIQAMIRGDRPLKYSRQSTSRSVRQTQGLPVRCPDCGGRVVMPCGTCRIRRLLTAGMLPKTYPDVPGQEEPLTLALQDEDQQRYLEVRHAKERQMFAEMLAEPEPADGPFNELEPTDEELRELE